MSEEQFTRNLYQLLAKQSGNVFFSPISLHAILSLAAQGSGGQTKEAFTKVLNVPDVKTAAESYNDVISYLNSVKDVTLLMANKVFLTDKYKLQEAFKLVATKHFYSEVAAIDFTNPVPAANSINSWVENKTNHKIKDLFNPDDFTGDTRLVLVNAIYFKGKWAVPFKVENTTTEKFHLNNSDTIDVKMMKISNNFGFKFDRTLDAKVLRLPYTNRDVSLIVILPYQKDGIVQLERTLAATDLTKISDNMFTVRVCVSLPKFRIEKTLDLQDSLTQLGLGEMFTDTANFSEMIDDPKPLRVSKVVQKAFIEVNEEGAEAAAATGMGMRCSSALPPPPPKDFCADHPFVIMLEAKQEDRSIILFKGRVSKPEY